MAVRIISAVVAIPLLLFFIICGGLPLRAAVLVLSLVGMGELYKAVSGKFKAVHFVGFALEVVYAFCMSKIHIFDRETQLRLNGPRKKPAEDADGR